MIATATIAPLAGVITLGDPIINVNTYGDEGRLAAAIVVALLAVVTEVALGGGAARRHPARPEADHRRQTPACVPDHKEGSDHMRTSRWVALLMLLFAALALGACGGDDDDAAATDASTSAEEAPAAGIQKNDENASTKLTIGSKNFTEQKVLGEIYAQALAAAGYDVSTELNLGDEKTALKALEQGEISAYPEYTGTALLSFFGVPGRQDPEGPAWRRTRRPRQGFAKKKITALPPTPFVSSNEVARDEGDGRRARR